MMEKCLI